MAENRLRRSLDGLFAQASAMLGAGPDFWQNLGLKHNTPERLAAFITTARQAEHRFHTAMTAKLQATAQRAALDSAAWDYLACARKVLEHHLGRRYSEKWAMLGFPNHSLRIPQRSHHRLAILDRLAAYWHAHPELECAQLDFTAERAARWHDDLSAANAAINHCHAEMAAALAARDEAVTALRQRMRWVMVELRMVMRKDDPRWLAFGLNQPATRRKRKNQNAAAPAVTMPVVSQPPTTDTAAATPPSASTALPDALDRATAVSNRPDTGRVDEVEPWLPEPAMRGPVRRERSLFARLLAAWN